MKDEKEFGISPAALMAALNGDLKNALIAATPDGIENQEAQGQQDFIASETLPTNCPREEFEKLGFVFGEVFDDIFTYVQFPIGWKKRATDHSMWSDLLDEKGRKRGSVFYKAAFYDRSAQAYLNCKISYSSVYDCHDSYIKDHIQFFVTDGECILYETKQIEVVEYSKKYWLLYDQASEEAKNWINVNYPDYKNPMAYWD